MEGQAVSIVQDSVNKETPNAASWSMRVSRLAGRNVGAVHLADTQNSRAAVFAVVDASTGGLQMWRNPREWDPLPFGETFGHVAKSLRSLQENVPRPASPRYYDLTDMQLVMTGLADPSSVAELLLATVARACISKKPATVLSELPAQHRKIGGTLLQHLLHSLPIDRMPCCPSLRVTLGDTKDGVFQYGDDGSLPLKLARVLMSEFPWAQNPNDKRTVAIGDKHRGTYIKVVPDGEHGMPTLRHAKLLMFATARMACLKNKNLDHSPTVRYPVVEFLRFAKIIKPNARATGVSLVDHEVMQACLHGTRIETVLETAKLRPLGQFHLLHEAGIDDTRAGAKTTALLRFSDWLYRATLDNDILTVSHEYLSAGPLKQALLLRVRKHCGTRQNPNPFGARWEIAPDALIELTRSGLPKNQFCARLKELEFDDYRAVVEPKVIIFKLKRGKATS